MRRHTKDNDLVFLAVELEIYRVVTFVAIQDEEAIAARSSRFGVLIEMLNPFSPLSFVVQPLPDVAMTQSCGRGLSSYQVER
jgi:hypothetical protein